MRALSFLLLLSCLGSLVGCGADTLVENDQQTPDPVVVDIPVAYITRPLTSTPLDYRNITGFNPGAQLWLKLGSAPDSSAINITDRAFSEGELYDVKDLSLSFDGKQLLFAMRAPEIENADQQPTWNIWQYDIANDQLVRVISSDIQAEQGEDTAPIFLPDGRILFSSTRQVANKAILLDEGKPQYQALDDTRQRKASVLHVMSADGHDVKQISHTLGHDYRPMVAASGKIIFGRSEWRGANPGVNLYQMDSDGKQLELLYGRHSHQQDEQRVHFTFAQPTSTGLLTYVQTEQAGQYHQHWVYIDPVAYLDNTGPVQASSGLTGPAQTPALYSQDTLFSALQRQGQVASVFPLRDGTERLLISWSPCRIVDPSNAANALPCTDVNVAAEGVQAAAPLFGLWLFDRQLQTQRPVQVAVEGQWFSEMVALTPSQPPLQSEYSGEPALIANNQGLLDIRSVYDIAGVANPVDISRLANPQLTPAASRPAQFLQIIKPVAIPDNDDYPFTNTAFGRSAGQGMRDILGYVPIEPDGSVRVAIPADVPFSLALVDGQGRRISALHESWLQLKAGEQRQCNGCHARNNTFAHGLIDREGTPLNAGAAGAGAFPGANPAWQALPGETMAQTRARIAGLPQLVPNLQFSDVWTNPATQTPAEDYALSYQDLSTAAPISDSCASQWQNQCRISVQFPDHIAPLFTESRPVLDELGEEVANHQCVSCHSPRDAEGLARVPAAQLDLSLDPSPDQPRHLIAYRELLFNDNEQELKEGALIDKLVQQVDADGNPVFLRDENGDLILDDNGQPIPVMVTVNVNPSMSTAGALASNRFFAPFAAANSHAGWLTAAEKRLLNEWLDNGGQYYNNPFLAGEP